MQELTHDMLEKLEGEVSKVAAAREAERGAERRLALHRLSASSRADISHLATKVLYLKASYTSTFRPHTLVAVGLIH